MSNPLFDETVMTVGTAVPTFEPATTHEDFLRRHEFQKWLDDTFAASLSVKAPEKPPRKRKPRTQKP